MLVSRSSIFNLVSSLRVRQFSPELIFNDRLDVYDILFCLVSIFQIYSVVNVSILRFYSLIISVERQIDFGRAYYSDYSAAFAHSDKLFEMAVVLNCLFLSGGERVNQLHLFSSIKFSTKVFTRRLLPNCINLNVLNPK